jgi:ferrous-iron efflux pump FieF
MISIVLTLALVMFQKFVVKRTGSIAISADSLHYRSDILVNVGIIAALVAVSTMGWSFVDPLAAFAVAAYILYGAWTIARQSFDMLMDRELPEEERQHIRDLVVSHDEVHDMHDLRTRSAGINSFIQLHIELDHHITVIHAHQIADDVEARIRVAYPEAEVIIHQDPQGLEEGHQDYT